MTTINFFAIQEVPTYHPMLTVNVEYQVRANIAGDDVEITHVSARLSSDKIATSSEFSLLPVPPDSSMRWEDSRFLGWLREKARQKQQKK